MPGGVLASAVIAAMPLLGTVHLDGDINGRGVLAWTGLRGSAFVAQATEVEAGRRIGRVRDLWRAENGVEVQDVDVASSGAAAVCLRERPPGQHDVWRVRVLLRSPAGKWSRPVLVAAPGRYVEAVDRAVDDAGNAALSWLEGIPARLRAAVVGASGTIASPVTLGNSTGVPDLEMGPDGTALVSFTTGGPDSRRLYLAEHDAAGGWSQPVQISRGDEPVQGPALAIDGAGRRLLAWNGGGEVAGAIRLATGTGTALVPETILTGYAFLSSLVAGTRGDVLVTYDRGLTGSDGTTSLRAVVARPGAAFARPVTLGRFNAYPLETALAADGSGLAAWVSGTDRRPRMIFRTMSADGRWGVTRRLSDTGSSADFDLGIAAGPLGKSTIAWSNGRPDSRVVRLRIAAA